MEITYQKQIIGHKTGHAWDYVKIALDYAKEVLRDDKHEIFGIYEWLSVKRFCRDLERAHQKDAPFVFSTWQANNVCDFLETLPHTKGTWESPNLVLEPWQVFLCVNLFGFRKANGARRFNVAYVEVARKNGKSKLVSGIALYCLLCEGENGPQVLTAATTGDQARIVYDDAKAMIDKTPTLRETFQIETGRFRIEAKFNNGELKPINAKGSTQDGWNPHLAIIDELHAHDDRSIFDVLRSAMGARQNPLSFYITTAGRNVYGVCYEQRSIASKILRGAYEMDHFFGAIYALDVDQSLIDEFGGQLDDPWDKTKWRKPNPNLGVSVQRSELENFAEEAQQSPASQVEFKTKRLNVWLNAASSWLNMANWDACVHPFEKDKETGRYILDHWKGSEAWIGVDLADKDDLCAVVMVIPHNNILWLFERLYLPVAKITENRSKMSPVYLQWREEKWIEFHEGDWVDHTIIQQDIEEWCQKMAIHRIVFDQFGGANQMASNLANKGYETAILPKNKTNYTDGSKALEAYVNAKKIRHSGSPPMRWMMENAHVTIGVDGSIIPKKEHANSPNKIDGVDATVMAVTEIIRHVDNEAELYGGYV